jgi:LPS sulfotransferase NodH
MSLFVVLTRGRTGSTPLVADINHHPEVVCHQELFTTEPIAHVHDTIAPYYETIKRAGRTLSAEQYLRETSVAVPAARVGFKALISHLDLRRDIGLERFLLESSMPVVFLVRDPLRAAISAAIAVQRGTFNLHVKEDDLDYRASLKNKVKLDPSFISDEARYFAYWADYWKEKLRAGHSPHIVVTYEDYLSNRSALINRIFRFLGVAEIAHLAENPYSKVTSDDVWSDIINADEIRQSLGLS